MLRSARLLFVRSNAGVGKSAPRLMSTPIKIPKNPIGMPQKAEITEKAELSQLKKALTSQNDPSQIVSG